MSWLRSSFISTTATLARRTAASVRSFGRFDSLSSFEIDLFLCLQVRMIGSDSSAAAAEAVVSKPVGFIGEFEQVARKYPLVSGLFAVVLGGVCLLLYHVWLIFIIIVNQFMNLFEWLSSDVLQIT
jgi:hypothetical protein